MTESENHLFPEAPFGGICPECSHDVIFYDTHESKKRGRYKCSNCSRDTIWLMGKVRTFHDVMKSLDEKIERQAIK